MCGATRDRYLLYPTAPALLADGKASELIEKGIEDALPYMVGRLGTPESNAVLNSVELAWSHSGSFRQKIISHTLKLRQEWDPRVIAALANNTGIFPPTIPTARHFIQLYTKDLGFCDLMGFWGMVPGESFLIRKFAPNAVCFRAPVLEPYLATSKPWSRALEGKKVLVIHPFAESIRSQYSRRKDLFPGTDVLPQFDLVTLQAVQSLAGAQTPFEDWFKALDFMTTKMENLDFDVCLVGAGAYSIPLCAHVKRRGKVAIYVGGSLQILFGIIGKRWESMPHINRLFNNAWVRPSAKEKFNGMTSIEGGCYW